MLKKTRKGAYAEYLANYMLSNLGFTAPVPRQEDYGIDLFCSLNQDTLNRTLFGDSYAIQIKSAFKPVVYGRTKKKWDQSQIRFLFELKLPFFLGIVDLPSDSLSIYPLSTFRFIKKQFPNCSLITFQMNSNPGGVTTIHDIHNVRTINTLEDDKGDHKNYIIDLQHPILKIDSKGLKNETEFANYHKILQKYIRLESINIAIDSLGWPTFHWPQNYTTNVDEAVFKWIHFDDEPHISNPDKIIDINSDLIIALALSFKLHNRIEEYDALCQITQKFKDYHKSHELGIKHAGLFEPIP